MGRHRLLLTWICFTLSGCYYIRDIQNQTIGSFAGGMGAGYLLVESSLMTTAGGVIAGSMIGSEFGQYFDNYGPLMTENPFTSPVHRYYYRMVRPTLEVDCFRSGRIYYNHSAALPRLASVPPTVNSLDNGVPTCHPKTL